MRIAVANIFILALMLGAARPCGADTRTGADRSSAPPVQMTHMHPVTSSMGCWLNHIYSVAFDRLGYDLDYRYYPAARASAMADAGDVDGELARTGAYGDGHPNLVRVQEPHLQTSFSAYSVTALGSSMDWDAIRDSGLKIGYVRGIERLEQQLRGVPAGRLQPVLKSLDGLHMLVRGRIDVFIGPDSNLVNVLGGKEFNGVRMFRHVLETHSGHAYLNKRHAALAGDLAVVLQALKREGVLERAAVQCGCSFEPVQATDRAPGGGGSSR